MNDLLTLPNSFGSCQNFSFIHSKCIEKRNENKYIYTICSQQHYSQNQKEETTQIPTSWQRTDKPNVGYPSNGMPSSHIKERSTVCASYTVDELWKHDVQWKTPGTKGHKWHEPSRIGECAETEKSVSDCQGLGVREEWERYKAKKCKVSLWGDKNVLILDNGDIQL